MLSPLMIVSPDQGKIYRPEPLLPEPEPAATAFAAALQQKVDASLAARVSDWIVLALAGRRIA